MLALHGCKVIITSRRPAAGEEAIATIKERNAKVKTPGLPAQGDVSLLQLDLADLENVKSAAAKLVKDVTSIDYLILNAGVAGVDYQLTKQGLEMHMGTSGWLQNQLQVQFTAVQCKAVI